MKGLHIPIEAREHRAACLDQVPTTANFPPIWYNCGHHILYEGMKGTLPSEGGGNASISRIRLPRTWLAVV